MLKPEITIPACFISPLGLIDGGAYNYLLSLQWEKLDRENLKSTDFVNRSCVGDLTYKTYLQTLEIGMLKLRIARGYGLEIMPTLPISKLGTKYPTNSVD
jgi:hypothetical protein